MAQDSIEQQPTVEKPKIQQRLLGAGTAGENGFSSRTLIFIGAAGGILLLGAAVAGVFLYAVASLFFGSDEPTTLTVQLAEPGQPVAQAQFPTDTPAPTATATPPTDRELAAQISNPPSPPPPTFTPLPPEPATDRRPQLLANSSIDFSSSQGNWRYLWSPPGANDWQPMIYESRQYGTCWYAKDYVRICEESGHPGNGADIAWAWVSPVAGPLEILIRAGKIDEGGDGVTISVYKNTTNTATEPIFSRPVIGDDETGFANKFIVESIQPDQFLFFVMDKNEEVTFDHTSFEVTICQISCP